MAPKVAGLGPHPTPLRRRHALQPTQQGEGAAQTLLTQEGGVASTTLGLYAQLVVPIAISRASILTLGDRTGVRSPKT